MRRALLLWFTALAVAFGTEPPQRIASYSPGATQTLLDLGISERIVAATRWCPLPPNHSAARNCDAFSPDLESLLQAKPDLVVLPRLANPLWAERCERAGLRVIVLQAEGRDSVSQDLMRIASETGRTKEAAILGMRLSAQPELPTKTLLVIWDGMMAGPEAYITAALKPAGFRSPLTSGTWIKLDWELLLKANPDAILFLDSLPENRPIKPSEKRQKEVSEVNGFKQLKSVKSGAIFESSSGSDWLPGTGLIQATEKLREARKTPIKL